MTERTTITIICFIGACATILVSAIAWGATHQLTIDVSCATLAGTALGVLGALLTTSGSATKPKPPETPTPPTP